MFQAFFQLLQYVRTSISAFSIFISLEAIL